jgi:conjugal transfer mating pair stabilization protein TraN
MTKCEVFNGEAATCKVALGGYKSCCETPSGVSLASYIKVMHESQDMANFAWQSDFMEPVRGTYTNMKSSVAGAQDWVANTDTYKAVSETFTSFTDNITGSVAGAAGDTAGGAANLATQSVAVVEQTIYVFKQQLMYGAQAFLELLDPTGTIANAIFTETATTEGGKQVGSQIGLSSQMASIVSFVGAVYTAYVIANLVIDLVYACSEEEIQLNVNRKLKKTHYIGTYCRQKVLGTCIEKRRSFCSFSSPLARIVNEQARPQLGIGWGSPSRPDCTGITLHQLTLLDWSQIDLGEWIDILDITGNMPGMSGMDIESMTGSGSFLNHAAEDSKSADGPLPPRLNSADRNEERLKDADIHGTQRDAKSDLWSGQ